MQKKVKLMIYSTNSDLKGEGGGVANKTQQSQQRDNTTKREILITV